MTTMPVSTKSRVPHADMRKVRDGAVISIWSEARQRFYKKVPEDVRFWAKVKKTKTCWLWTAGTQNGYGSFDARTAHSWIAKNVMHVVVTPKMVIDHACRNPLCVRPHREHLRFVSQKVNLTNESNPVGLAILKTHCKRGHKLTGNNAYHPPKYLTRRCCRACLSIREKLRRKRSNTHVS